MGCAASVRRATDDRRREKVAKHRETVLKAMKTQYSAAAMLDDPRMAFTVSIFAALPVPVVVWAEDGEILHANGCALEMLGHDETTVRVGNHITKLLELPPAVVDDWTAMCFKEVVGVQAKLPDGGRSEVSLFTVLLELSEESSAYLGVFSSLQSSAFVFEKLGKDVLLNLTERYGSVSTAPSSAGSARSSRSGTSPNRAPRASDGSPAARGSSGSCGKVPSLKMTRSPTRPSSASPQQSPRMGALAQQRTATDLELLESRGAPAGNEVDYVRVLSGPIQQAPRVHFSRSLLSEDTCHLLDSIQHPTMVLGWNGQIVHWNPACEQIYGPTAEDMFGHSVNLLLPHPYHIGHDRHIAESLSRLPPEGNKRREIKCAERLSDLSRQALLRIPRDLVARTIRSSSMIPVRDQEDNEIEGRKWQSRIIPVRVIVAEFAASGGVIPYWLVMTCVTGARCATSMAHSHLMRGAVADHPDHPAEVPAERPALDPKIVKGAQHNVPIAGRLGLSPSRTNMSSTSLPQFSQGCGSPRRAPTS